MARDGLRGCLIEGEEVCFPADYWLEVGGV